MRPIISLTMLAACCICALPAIAQSVSGRVTDVQSQPIPFVNIVVLNADSAFISGCVSDNDGLFRLELPQGGVMLSVTSIGYKKKFVALPSPLVAALGDIALEKDTYLLGEVVVKGDLPKTRIKGDALETTVAGSLLEKAGTAHDVLGKLPGVVASGSSLSVLGRGTPLVYINGREVRSASELDQLSSDNIRSIDVVTIPGARYRASVKAVIRIRTKKVLGDGFGFNNRLYARYNKQWSYLEQFNFNYRKNGFDLSGMLFGSRTASWTEFNMTQQTYLDKQWTQQTHSYQTDSEQNIYTTLTLNYQFNPNHSIGVRHNFRRVPGESGNFSFDTDVSLDNAPFEQTFNTGGSSGQSSRHEVNLYYNGQVKQLSIDFNADMLYNFSDETLRSAEQITHTESGDEQIPVDTRAHDNNHLYAGKLTLTHPLWGGSLSVGGEYSHTQRHSTYAANLLPDNVNRIEEGYAAGFAEYSRMLFGRVNVQAGLRLENTRFDYYESGVHRPEQSKNYTDLFPSIAVGTQLGKLQAQLSYKTDITRPSYGMLSNVISYANRYTYQTGNPFLLPTVSRGVMLMAVYEFLQFSAGMQRTRNAFIYSMDIYTPDNPAIGILKMINDAPYNSMILSLNMSPTIGLWTPRWGVSMFKQWYRTDTYLGDNIQLGKPVFNISLQNSFSLPLGVLWDVDVDWNSRGHQLNMYQFSSYWGVNTSLYKSFLKGNLTFQLYAADLFGTIKQRQQLYFGKLRLINQTNEANSRQVSLTIRYKFNSANNKYKGSGAGSAQKNRL